MSRLPEHILQAVTKATISFAKSQNEKLTPPAKVIVFNHDENRWFIRREVVNPDGTIVQRVQIDLTAPKSPQDNPYLFILPDAYKYNPSENNGTPILERLIDQPTIATEGQVVSLYTKKGYPYSYTTIFRNTRKSLNKPWEFVLSATS